MPDQSNFTERDTEQLFAAIEPGTSIVIGIYFTRGRPETYEWTGKSWQKAAGAGDYEFKHIQMVPVLDEVLDVFDRAESDGESLVHEDLVRLGLIDSGDRT